MAALAKAASQLKIQEKAYDLLDRVSDREKFYISSHCEENVTGHLEKAVQLHGLRNCLSQRRYGQNMIGEIFGKHRFHDGFQSRAPAFRHALDAIQNPGLRNRGRE
jgi:hypothetical protein